MTIHNDIDKVFQKGLAEHSQTPPPFIWDNIENTLNKKRSIRNRSKIYGVAAATALLISFGAGYMFNLFNTNTDLIAQQSEQTEVVDDITESNNAVETINFEENALLEKNDNASIDDNNTPTNTVNASSVKESHDNSTTKDVAPVKKSKVKKAMSSGTMLPPMFASESEFKEEASHAPVFNDDETKQNEAQLIKMSAKKGSLNHTQTDPQLKYNYQDNITFEDAYYNAPKQKVNKWGVGINATPLISYRNVTSNSTQNIASADNISSHDQNYANEQPLVSYSAGVDVSYGLSKRWKVHSGIYFSETGQVSKDINVSSAEFSGDNSNLYAINTSSSNININNIPTAFVDAIKENSPTPPAGLPPGSPVPPGVSNVDLVYALNYYEIPLLVSYKIVDRKLNLNISGGISANIMHDNSTYITENGQRYDVDADMTDLKSSNYNGVFGVGMNYPILTQLHFNLQPTLRYSLNPINNSGTVYPYSFGLYTGLKYSF